MWTVFSFSLLFPQITFSCLARQPQSTPLTGGETAPECGVLLSLGFIPITKSTFKSVSDKVRQALLALRAPHCLFPPRRPLPNSLLFLTLLWLLASYSKVPKLSVSEMVIAGHQHLVVSHPSQCLPALYLSINFLDCLWWVCNTETKMNSLPLKNVYTNMYTPILWDVRVLFNDIGSHSGRYCYILKL